MKQQMKVSRMKEIFRDTNSKFRNKENGEEYFFVNKSDKPFQKEPLIILKSVLTGKLIEIEENKVEQIN